MLSILIWLPLAAALLGALVPLKRAGGILALGGALGSLGLTIALIANYGGHGYAHVTDVVWIRSLGIHYALAIDGLNLFLVALTTFSFALAVAAANIRDWPRPRVFYALFALAESAVLGAFLAQDLALFVAFFDLMLIPFYLLLGIWGGPGRVAATLKLVIYTFVGSLLMLAGAIALAILTSEHSGHPLSFALQTLAANPLHKGSQEWIFLLFAAAFLVKMPAFPLHGWMPDAYREMPVEVLAVFSGVLSKVGAYGFLAIVLPIMPLAAVHFQTLILVLALCSIIYGSAMAFTVTNARLIAGYSSIAQLGFITLGIFAFATQGAQGAVLQMVNHGLVVAPLFLIIGLLAARARGSDDIRDMGGIAFRAPVLATFFLIVAFATLAMPGSGNFIGEFLILLGLFKTKMVFSIIAFTGVVMASVYALRLYIRAMHNRVGPKVQSREMSLRNGLVLVPFIGALFLFAIYPQLQLHRSESFVTNSIAREEHLTGLPARAVLFGGAAHDKATIADTGAGK